MSSVKVVVKQIEHERERAGGADTIIEDGFLQNDKKHEVMNYEILLTTCGKNKEIHI